MFKNVFEFKKKSILKQMCESKLQLCQKNKCYHIKHFFYKKLVFLFYYFNGQYATKFNS